VNDVILLDKRGKKIKARDVHVKLYTIKELLII